MRITTLAKVFAMAVVLWLCPRLFSPYTIAGIYPGMRMDTFEARFPEARSVPHGGPISGGETCFARAFNCSTSYYELSGQVIVGFQGDIVNCIEGPRLEHTGKPADLGKPDWGSSSDADYSTYAGGVVTRTDRGITTYGLHD